VQLVMTPCFFVFGGKFPNGSSSDRLFSFNLPLSMWSEVSSENYPPPRNGATMISDNKEGLVVYGGCNDTTIMNDIWYFNMKTKKWNIQSNSEKGMMDSTPTGRFMHTAVLATVSGNLSMIIYGGTDGHTEFSDVWLYFLESKEWTEAKTDNFPKARKGHTSIYHQGRMITFGGIIFPNTMMNDMWQFIPISNCYLGCETCLTSGSLGCGWCSQSDSKCASGSESGPYLPETCDSKYFSMKTCAPPLELNVWWFLSGGIAIGLLFGVGFFTGNNYCKEEDYVEIK